MKLKISTYIGLLGIALNPMQTFAAEPTLLNIAQRNTSEGDPRITSIGVFSTETGTAAHFDLVQYDDARKGEAWAVEFGAGYLLPTQIPVYIGGGVALGYRRQGGEYYSAWYPEAGAVLQLLPGLGVSVSKKRYQKLFGKTEDVLMFGVALTMK